MKIIKRILLGLLAVTVLLALGFIVWAETPLGPAPEALSALESDSQVTVIVDDFITFQPANPSTGSGQALQPVTGFIFYPGGRVDYRSYAAPLREIAAQGYLVLLVPVRLNMALFDINAAQPVLASHPEIQNWAAGGHSLGGVASALFAKDHPEIEGLIFWASYPADDSLRNSGLKMLSIYGTNDMAGMTKFDETKILLTADAKYIVIDGGNHAQFGDYGPQPGDNAATISRADQQAQVIQATVEFLKELGQ